MPRDPRAAVQRPVPAEIARAAITAARIASVRTVCAPRLGRLAIASVEPSPTGDLMFRLDARSPLVAQLTERYTVTVTIAAPAPFSSLVAVGRARPVPDEEASSRCFAVDVAGLNLHGPCGQVEVDVDEFWTIEDDPLAVDAFGLGSQR